MAEVATSLTDFTTTTRTGRRNAMPDILDVESTVTNEELVVRLDSLAIADGKGDVASGGQETNSSTKTEGDMSKTEHSDPSGSDGS